MWIQRGISSKLEEAVGSFPAILLTGARQVGKTSLFKKIYPKHNFVTLDLPSHAELAENRPEEFLNRFPPPVIIDEVQYAPALFRYLKIKIDENRHRYGQFLLTGSQKFALMKGASESLAGRCAVLELETLSLKEATAAKQISETEMMFWGGFPELQSRTDLDPNLFFQSYISTYLERDVRSLLHVGQLRDFERFVRACGFRSGQVLNKAELARDVGISPPTANEWLSVLQASNQILLLEPWFNNKTKGLIKSPKIYMADTGLLCSLVGLQSIEELLRSPLLGAIWETFIFAELRKRETFKTGSWALWFWSDRNLEADFLVAKGGRFKLMEAKFSENPPRQDALKLEQIAEKIGRDKVDAMTIISRTKEGYPLSPSVMTVPVKDL